MTPADLTAELMDLARAACPTTDQEALRVVRQRARVLYRTAMLDVLREVHSAVLCRDAAALDSWTAAGLIDPALDRRDLEDHDTMDALAHDLFAATPAGIAYLRIAARC